MDLTIFIKDLETKLVSKFVHMVNDTLVIDGFKEESIGEKYTKLIFSAGGAFT